MSRRFAAARVAIAALVALAAVAAVAAVVWLASSHAAARPGDATGAFAAANRAVVGEARPTLPAPGALALERWPAELYFPAASDRLVTETRQVASDTPPRARTAAILAELLAAKPSSPRVPVFPGVVEVGKVIPLADGTMVVDLRSEAADPPPSGSTVELLRVYALVHSVLRNVPEASQVVLLWNGSQRRSFAGHVDTSRPLRARLELEAAPSTDDADAAADIATP